MKNYHSITPKNIFYMDSTTPPIYHLGLQGKRILILGSKGFVGQHLTSKLIQQNIIPFEICNRSDCNLTNYKDASYRIKRDNPEIIIHLAASPDTISLGRQALRNFLNTILCTINIVTAARKLDHCVIVHVGSYKQYGKAPIPFRETQLVRPLNIYGLAKQISESILRMHENHRLKVVSLRMGPLFGPGQGEKYLIPHVIRAILSGSKQGLVAVDTQWDPAYIADAVNAIFLSATSPNAWGKIVNISGGIPYSPYQVIEYIIKTIEPSCNPPIKLVKSVHSADCLGDITLAREILKWRPMVSIPDAICYTIDYYRSLIVETDPLRNPTNSFVKER